MQTAVSPFEAPAAVTEPRTPNRAAVVVRPRRLRFLVAVIAGSGILWACYFPLALGWLAWIALVPQMTLIRCHTGRLWRYACAWLGGLFFFGSAISWMTVADQSMIACWALLTAWCSLFPPVTLFLIRRLQRHTALPLVLTFPAAWTAMEYLRSFLLTGFPWYLIAHTQHDTLVVTQIADLGGAFAVSFLVAAVNAVAFEALLLLGPVQRFLGLTIDANAANRKMTCARLAVQAAVVAALLAGTVAYGTWRLGEETAAAGPRLALLQASVDQRLRIQASRSPDAEAQVRETYVNLCLQAARLKPLPDMIVWPETSFPTRWIAVEPSFDLAKKDERVRRNLAHAQEDARTIAALSGTHQLLGLNTYVMDETHTIGHYNSALLLDGKGREGGRYDKIHRVPFGEYLPLKDVLPFMNAFSPYDFDYSIGQGPGLTRLQLGKYTFGVLICYEDSDPFMGREYCVATKDGPPADFLLNISNDGWFDGSSEHEEHLAISRFRAIESRRAVARAVNMGISAVIDPCGRVLAPVQTPAAKGAAVWTIPASAAERHELPPNEWHNFKQVAGILVVDMPVGSGGTIYAQFGDVMPAGCWILIGCGIAWRWRRRNPGESTQISAEETGRNAAN
jgi:apolipoprotein N-acyltransferase